MLEEYAAKIIRSPFDKLLMYYGLILPRTGSGPKPSNSTSSQQSAVPKSHSSVLLAGRLALQRAEQYGSIFDLHKGMQFQSGASPLNTRRSFCLKISIPGALSGGLVEEAHLGGSLMGAMALADD